MAREKKPEHEPPIPEVGQPATSTDPSLDPKHAPREAVPPEAAVDHKSDVAEGSPTPQPPVPPAEGGSAVTVELHGHKVRVEAGDREIILPTGERFGSIACGEHNGTPHPGQVSLNPAGGPDGFQPQCLDCNAELNSTVEAAYRQGALV